MIEYEVSSHPELSAIRNLSGDIYHFKGLYRLITSIGAVLPVNRSYSPDAQGNRGNIHFPSLYRRNRLIHEEAAFSSQIQVNELLMNIYHKPLLFLQDNPELTWYSSHFESNDFLSSGSDKLATNIKNNMLRSGFNHEYQLGVFGSNQPGLNSVDSDMDLIAWVSILNKSEFLDKIHKTFREMGYKTTKETGKDVEYAAHYSRKFQIPIQAGCYLADKRMRWISSEGVPTSLQCINSDYNHTPAKKFLQGIDKDWESSDIVSECRVISADDSYNFPKVWKLALGHNIIDAISFSWSHQGMGDDGAKFGHRYLFKGAKITGDHDDFLYLRDSNDYLLPMNLL